MTAFTSPMQKQRTMVNSQPTTYVNNMAMLMAHGALSSGSRISSVIWAVACNKDAG